MQETNKQVDRGRWTVIGEDAKATFIFSIGACRPCKTGGGSASLLAIQGFVRNKPMTPKHFHFDDQGKAMVGLKELIGRFEKVGMRVIWRGYSNG